MKRLLIWDFDGPIVDSRELALELTQYQYKNVTADSHRDLSNGNILTELAKLDKKDVSDEEISDFLETSYWPRKMEFTPVEGIKEILSALSRDFMMVINSSSAGAQIVKYLEKNDLRPFFQKIYGNEIPSKEEKFGLILKEFDISSKDCLMITDTVGDVLEAAALEIPSVVVLWGYQLREHFTSVSTKVPLVESPPQLLKAITDHFSVV